MPKGGRRIGSGRKPGKAWAGRGVVLGLDGIRQLQPPVPPQDLPPAISAAAKTGLLRAPTKLHPDAGVYWELWAQEAIDLRMLTPATAAGFAEVCQRAAFVGKIGDKIEMLGADTQDAIPYLGLYDRMAQKLEVSLARFGLTAFGKPVTSDKPKPVESPWAQVAVK